MKASEITRDMIRDGQHVQIEKRDRRQSSMVEGAVSKILTNAASHPHGILVRLQSGEEGRVQALLDHGGSTESTSRGSESERPTKDIKVSEILKLREDQKLEFKEGLFWSEELDPDELKKGSNETKKYGKSASRVIAAKVIAAFLNSGGGRLVVGVKEDKAGQGNAVVGIERDYSGLKDKCEDGYRRKIVDGIVETYFPEDILNNFDKYLRLHFHPEGEETLCIVDVTPSEKPVFLTVNKKEKLFVIRVDASNRILETEETVKYCSDRFS
jgi:uncharacterized repeat protein (TIGR03833 family)